MSRRVRYALLTAFLLVAAAFAWVWTRTSTLEKGETVDLNGNPVPDDHSGLLRTGALILVLVVVIPAVRTGLARAVRAAGRGRERRS